MQIDTEIPVLKRIILCLLCLDKVNFTLVKEISETEVIAKIQMLLILKYFII